MDDTAWKVMEELFWPAFSCIRTEYGEILRFSLYLVQIQKNVDQNNSIYGHFLRSVCRIPMDFCYEAISMVLLTGVFKILLNI